MAPVLIRVLLLLACCSHEADSSAFDTQVDVSLLQQSLEVQQPHGLISGWVASEFTAQDAEPFPSRDASKDASTHFLVVNSHVQCNLTFGQPTVELTSGESLNFPPEHSDRMLWTCVQAGALAKALAEKGVNTTIANFNTPVFWHDVKAVVAKHQRVNIVAVGFSTARAVRDSAAVFLWGQMSGVRWVGVGENLGMSSSKCDDEESVELTQGGVGDVRCLAKDFDLLMTNLHSKVSDFNREVGHLRAKIEYINPIASDALWDDARQYHAEREPKALRMLVDCDSRMFEHPNFTHSNGITTSQSERLDILFSGIQEYHTANPHSPRVHTTLLQCEDSRADEQNMPHVTLAEFYRFEASQDIYATVIRSTLEFCVVEEQMAGALVFSVGGVVIDELFRPNVSAIEMFSPEEVSAALKDFEPGTRDRVHDWAKPRYGADIAADTLVQQVSTL